MLKKLLFLISTAYTITLGTVCLIKINKLPEIGVCFADKIFHFLTYTVLTFLWFGSFFYTFKFEKNKALVYACVFSILFGIIIEVLQGVLTTFRTPDIYDVIANLVGVFLTVIIISVKNFITIKK